MEILYVVIGVVTISLIVFVALFKRPLSKEEEISLGNKRRKKQIKYYFSFEDREYSVDKEFKKRMSPNGKFYKVDESLFEFPSLGSALLKYKKHEWIILGYEKGKTIRFIWINKGPDRSSVSSRLSLDEIKETALSENITSVLVLHNHPNSNPNSINCQEASNQDIISAKGLARILKDHGINLIEFVGERGRHYEFYRSISKSFLPVKDFIRDIKVVNGVSKSNNLLLHFERIF